MNKARRNSLFALMFVLTLAPALSLAQSASANFTDINTCNQQSGASLPSSIGAFAATGGVYVPVSDATVELNTGTLVYEECILRVLVDSERQAMTAGIEANATNNILTGRNGSAEFLQQFTQAVDTIGANAVQAVLQNDLTDVDSNDRTPIQSAIAQGYATAIFNAQSTLTCPYQGATTDFTSANPQGNVWNDILAVASPCNPLIGYEDANDLAINSAAQEVQCQEDQWMWGGGFYSVTNGSGGPCEQQILTPSSDVNNLYQTVTQTGFNQLQSANDIGQLVQPLFAGISSEVLSSSFGGIAGLTSPIGGQPSYLQQAVSQESGNFQSTVSGDLSQSIQTAIQSEQTFLSDVQQIQSTLANAASQLNAQQNACWQTVAQAICGSSFTLSSTNTTCSDSSGSQITFATSSDNFAQAAIGNSQIASYATTVNNDATVAQALITQLNAILQQSQSSQSSASASFSAIQGQVANSSQITNVQNLAQQVSTYLGSQGGTGFIPNVLNNWQGNTGQTDSSGNPEIASWAGTLPPNGIDTGWCNASTATVSAWESKF